MLTLCKRKLTMLAVMAAMLVLLAACAVPVAPEAPADTTTSSGETAATGEKTKVVFWAHVHEPRVPLDEKYIAEFMEANPDIEVEYEVIPSGDYDTKLRTALAAGTGLTVYSMPASTI